MKADEILAYYEENGFKDWTHAESGAPVLKAQHPEFELWSQGIHARSGVACADCHMPYQRVGAMKVTDHHIRSPLLNVNRACQTCHRWPEDELKARVQTIQDRTYQVCNVAMDALIALIAGIKNAKSRGATDPRLAAARGHQRRAQFLLDFIEAENSMGFHADQEAVRVLALSLDETRRGQAALPGSPAPAGASATPAAAADAAPRDAQPKAAVNGDRPAHRYQTIGMAAPAAARDAPVCTANRRSPIAAAIPAFINEFAITPMRIARHAKSIDVPVDTLRVIASVRASTSVSPNRKPPPISPLSPSHDCT